MHSIVLKLYYIVDRFSQTGVKRSYIGLKRSDAGERLPNIGRRRSETGEGFPDIGLKCSGIGLERYYVSRKQSETAIKVFLTWFSIL